MRQSAVDVIRRNGLTGSMKNKLELPPGLGLSLISHFCPFTTTTAKLDSSICFLCPRYLLSLLSEYNLWLVFPQFLCFMLIFIISVIIYTWLQSGGYKKCNSVQNLGTGSYIAFKLDKKFPNTNLPPSPRS